MKPLLGLSVTIVIAVAAAWTAARVRHIKSTSKEALQDSMMSAGGRIQFVSPGDLIASPGKYHGKRILLSAMRSSVNGHSTLAFSTDMKGLRIVTETILNEVAEPGGDFTNTEVRSFTLSRPWHKIVAEGTFFYSQQREFGCTGGSNAFFLIDRIYRCDEADKPDIPLQQAEPEPPEPEDQS
ncbi:MAG: hypothetical protein QM790_11535 [Nibricoccus sp.]